MDKEFTRIEFEGGEVVVVKTFKNRNGYTIQGNSDSAWDMFISSFSDSHFDVVERVIGQCGKRVERKLSYKNMN